jgi:hypothetical protein
LSLWDSYDLSNFELHAGNFSEDSRGRWYLNVCVPRVERAGEERIKLPVGAILASSVPSLGIDLGLKSFAAFSTSLVKTQGAIFVGNVNASALAKTRQAKARRPHAVP